ncbi:MAG: hypothetical protein K6B65_05600 [Bacilli bacterium]|nr:hypothetical protein [Bacilli bacterium]
MKRNSVLLAAASLLCLPSCQNVVNSEFNPSFEDDDESLLESEESAKAAITVEDFSDHYYVGETFSKVFKGSLSYESDGKSKDITQKKSSYSYRLKDNKGKEISADEPFKEAGEYTFQVYLNKKQEDTSSEIKINVKPSPTNVLNERAKIPEGFNYDDFEASCLSNLSFPSTGEINALVIPVEVSDYPFENAGYGNDYLSKINALFNGNGESDTGYWESISSYYQKSSMGALKINFEVADVYECGYDSNAFLGSGESAAFAMANLAVGHYKEVNGASSTQKFDNDKDGYIDGLWMVYSAPNYSSGAYGDAAGQKVFWAFCADDGSMNPDLGSPTAHSFGWASIDFALEGTEAPAVDAHTFIHETGHLLALPDYYSYDFTGANASGAQGGLAMMDLNIGDQDSFSKFSLGWSKPYYPTQDCIIELKPNTTSGDCIVLCDSWNGTAFDEYLLLDLVSPIGLNELDSSTAYYGRPPYYTEPGIRMYHVDARLGEMKYISTNDGLLGYEEGVNFIKSNGRDDYYASDERVKEILAKGSLPRMDKDGRKPFNERNSGFMVINANSGSRVAINESLYVNNRLLTLVGADGKHCEIDNAAASNSSLFHAGDSWTNNPNYIRFFSGEGDQFNNGDSFSYVFSVLSCDANSAKIQIRKI